jgi:hypothetical protein
MPQTTTVGVSYQFPKPLDPTLMEDRSTTYFDAFLPYLADETTNERGYLLVLDVSKWFTNTTQIIYTLNTTDNSGVLPLWITLDPNTGKMILDPPSDSPSMLLNLQFTVSDLNRGWASLKKTLLLNTPPKVVSTYEHLTLAVNRKFNKELSSMFYDNDPLTYSTDSDSLFQRHNLIFHKEDCRITGTPQMIGRSSRI